VAPCAGLFTSGLASTGAIGAALTDIFKHDPWTEDDARAWWESHDHSA
jgi:hypothetical protein